MKALIKLADGPVSGELSLPTGLTLVKTYDGLCKKAEAALWTADYDDPDNFIYTFLTCCIYSS